MEIYYVSKQTGKRKYVMPFASKEITNRSKLLNWFGFTVPDNKLHLVRLDFNGDNNQYQMEDFKASCLFIKVLTYLLLFCLTLWQNESTLFCTNGLAVLVSAFFLQKEETRVLYFNYSHH